MSRKQKGERKPHKLSRIIATSVSATFAIIIVLSFAAITVVSYASANYTATNALRQDTISIKNVVTRQIDNHVTAQSDTLANGEADDEKSDKSENDIENAVVTLLEQQGLGFSERTRITYIAADGTVLYDNQSQAGAMRNHLQREEIQEAKTQGFGQARRKSATIGEETVYYAVKIDNHGFLRLARTQRSILGFAAVPLPAIAIILVLALCASWVIGQLISRRVTSELSHIDIDEPLQGESAQEIMPLLERLDEQRKQLRMQEMERRRFTSNASHELKTPLTVVAGYAELMSEGLVPPDDIPRFAKDIQTEAYHMRTIVDDMLTLSRFDEMEGESRSSRFDDAICIEDVVHTVFERLTSMAADGNVSLRLEETGHTVIRGNKSMISEMIRNLVENAIRYNERGGSVDVRVRSVDGDEKIRIDVADTGVGIAPRERDKIFERFYRVENSHSRTVPGSGLGLAIVKHAISLHKGTIAVTNNSPHGSVFTVILPKSASRR